MIHVQPFYKHILTCLIQQRNHVWSKRSM